MRILAIGDVVGSAGLELLEEKLWGVRRRMAVDFVAVNGENATDVRGISTRDAERLFSAGADLITLGNHAFGQKDLFPLLDGERPILRPANYPPAAPGRGYDILKVGGWRILCVNASGRVNLDPLDDPFDTIERILAREAGNYDLSLLDFHAEATSEKVAVGRAFDGRFAAVYGTHTHVPTADATIFPGGTGYVTDLGMCGPVESIIGCEIESVLRSFRTMVKERLHAAHGPAAADAVLFTVDEERNRTTKIERVRF